ncbi:MAG: hypothetical protein H7A53_08880, partial [Akkermansiaceae bacterium]|nr:hypothetical protein [Akkermansiaceae bacterium]
PISGDLSGGSLPVIGIGQAGCQMAAAFWLQLCEDHRIDPHSGKSVEGATGRWEKLFTRVRGGGSDERFVPRAVFIDSDPRTGHDLKRKWRELFNPALFVAAQEGSGNNCAIGYHERWSEISSDVRAVISRVAEKAPAPGGAIVFHSYGGGSGGGLGVRVLEVLGDMLSGVPLLSVGVLPSRAVSVSVTEPYNAVFGMAGVLKHASLGLIFQNEHLQQLAARAWDTPDASQDFLNSLIARVVGAVTAPVRFDGADGPARDLGGLLADLGPHPDFRLATGTVFPLETLLRRKPSMRTAAEVLAATLERYQDLCPCADGTVMSLGLYGSGRANRADLTGLGRGLNPVESDLKAEAVDIPHFVRLHLAAEPSPHSAVSVVVNSSKIGEMLDEMCERFDRLWVRRAFANWYLDAGMTEGNFDAVRREVGFKARRYGDL